MHSTLVRSFVVSMLFAALFTAKPTVVPAAEIFATDGSAAIGEYTSSGSTVNASLVTGLRGPDAITVSGGNLYVGESGSVGEYTTTGATVSASLVSGLPYGIGGIAVSGGNLYVSFPNSDNGVVGEYNASTGATINAALVTDGANGIAVSGNDLYVANVFTGTVGEFDATTGDAINGSLITGLDTPWAIAVSGGDLFVVSLADGQPGNGTIGEYDATTGSTINASLITGLSDPSSVAVLGSDLFVSNLEDGRGSWIGEYTTSGATINADLVSVNVGGLAVTPEPSTWVMLLTGTVALWACALRKRRVAA